MTQKKETNDNSGPSCCRVDCKVESALTIDARGQMVLPKEFRETATLKAGDNLALISWDRDGDICCMALLKTDELANMVKGFLGPIMGEII